MRATQLACCGVTASLASNMVERSIRTRDLALRVVSVDGTLRVVYASTIGLLREAVRRHRLAERTNGHRQFMELLGTHLTFTSILAALQEGEERVVSRFTADEATVVTEALALGECRCHVSGEHNKTLDGPPFPLRVDRFLYGQSMPFSSVTAARMDLLLHEDEEEKCGNDAVLLGRLKLKDVPRESLEEFFCHNISFHGRNFFRQSEGSAAALWCCARLCDSSIERALARVVEDALVGNSSNVDSADIRLDTALQRAGLSCGVLVQPLLAGHVVDGNVHRLQEALVRASIEDRGGIFSELFNRARVEGLGCQDIISLVSGDYEGAYAVASAARQFTQDPSVAAPMFERLRLRLGINEFCFRLDSSTLVRNRLDYFCRCSKESFLQSVLMLPKEELVRLAHETSFRCIFCAKEHQLLPEDWQYVLQRRGMKCGVEANDI